MRSWKERDGMKRRAKADALMAKCEEKRRLEAIV
jgi:hypothetical protein